MPLFELGSMALSCGRELPDASPRLPVFGELKADSLQPGALTPAPTAPGLKPSDWVVGPILDPTAGSACCS